MDFTTLIVIIVSLVVVYFFIKLVVSPLLKALLGIIVFVILIYIFQRIFNLDLSHIIGINLDFNKIPYFNLISSPLNNIINQGKAFLESIFKNITQKS